MSTSIELEKVQYNAIVMTLNAIRPQAVTGSWIFDKRRLTERSHYNVRK